MTFHLSVSMVLFFLFSCAAFASSCQPGPTDPYRMIDITYEQSDLVFYGELRPSPTIIDSRLLKVISKWKGPNVNEVQLVEYERQPAGAPYFASRSDSSNRWYANWLVCIEHYLPPEDTVSAYLERKYGAPTPQIADSVHTPTMLLVAGLFLGVGAIGIWSWSARNV